MRYIDNNLLISETAAPTPCDNQVLVSVDAFGVNRADLLQRQGKYPAPAHESPILGLEVAGKVIQCGPKVTKWSVGDRVMGLVAGGGYAQNVVVHQDHLMPIADSLSTEEAAGLCEVFSTAYQALVVLADVQKHEKIMIHAGASGVGLACVQVAKLLGCEISVSVSNQNKAKQCKKLGASLAVCYPREDFVTAVKTKWEQGADVIVDLVCGNYMNRNLDILATDGRIICLSILGGRHVERFDLAKILAKRAKLIGSTLRNRSDSYKAELIADFSQQLLPALVNRDITVPIDSVYPATRISEAHEKMASNQTMGKLIVYWE